MAKMSCSTYTFPHVLCDPPAESCKRPPMPIHPVLFAIWGVCPQMTISDTCRHVPDTFLHVPCPCLPFRSLPPLPASLYPPPSQGRNSVRLGAQEQEEGIPSETLVSLSPILSLYYMAGCSSLGFRMTLSCMCGCSVGSCSLRTASHSNLPIMSSEFTLPCILCSPRIGWLKLRPLSIRSFTFRATLPFNP